MTYAVKTLALLMVVTLFIVNVSGFSAQRYTRSNSTQQNQRYGVLLDAGSSGTKVNIFSYTPAEFPSLVPHVQLTESEKVKPGLSTFSDNLDGVFDHIAAALSQARTQIPEQLQASAPVYVMGTAGLRILPASQVIALLQSVRDVLSNSSVNPFYFEEDYVSILSGEEEGVYAWVAANYLHGFFSTNMTREDSVGLLEMGGGSLQVAFLPDDPIYQGEFQVYVGRHRFDLYAHSYLGFGSNYIRDQVRQVLVEKSKCSRVKVLKDPCMLVDDVTSYEADGVTIQVSGTGRPKKCTKILKQILEAVDASRCSPKPCAIRNTYQPAVGDLHFYAISAFLYAPLTVGALQDGGILNITELAERTWEYCTWNVSEAVNRTGTSAKYASSQCLMGLYIAQLLVNSFGFNLDTDHITVTQEIDDKEINWALGAMIQHLSIAFMDDLESAIHCRQGDKVLPLNRARA